MFCKYLYMFMIGLTFFASKAACADELSCGDDCEWHYDEVTKTLTISGSGAMKDYGVDTHIPDFSIYTSQRPWNSIASQVEHIEISGLTSVGNCAFVNMMNVKTVSISDTVQKIEGYAFYNLNKVTNLNIPESVTSIEYAALYGMTSLTSLNIPDSVTSIGDYAFRASSAITELSIPASVTEIGEYAFSNMTNLKNITIGDNVESIAKGAFAGTSSLEKIYCQGEERCQELLSTYHSSRIEKLAIFEKNGDVYIYDGVNYASPEDMMIGESKSCGTISQCEAKIEQNKQEQAQLMSGGTLCNDKDSCLSLMNMAEEGTHCHTVASCYAWLFRQEKNADGSLSIYENGEFVKFKNKRIYTIEEAKQAVEAAGTDTVKFRIKYK